MPHSTTNEKRRTGYVEMKNKAKASTILERDRILGMLATTPMLILLGTSYQNNQQRLSIRFTKNTIFFRITSRSDTSNLSHDPQ